VIHFAYVDVFADVPLAGNPATVVPNADGLSDESMKALAREFNLSETAFILRPALPGADWKLRSFTPAGAEVGGVGHHVLGASWWMAETGVLALSDGENAFMQEIDGHMLPLTIMAENGRVTRIAMRQGRFEVGTPLNDLSQLSSALSIPLDAFDEDLPVQPASTGVAHLMVAVRNRAALDELNVDQERLRQVLRSAGAEGCYVFTLSHEDEADAHARFFNPTVGIAEDPATGTAAGPLACLLIERNSVPGPIVRIAQGAHVQRPSLIEVFVDGGIPEIRGSAVIAGSGSMQLHQQESQTSATVPGDRKYSQ
jgi:PhzF family phenazine biosynthesis protein